ncbi:hypothetical protein SARC_11533 [Sphaeroforma arctica JP610]|uniref:Uncharacterized protein n=1 Tax=Sphaeroforma arctica JP610 TaxID=667725 RepID=A0A0L0FGP5_9EUKA|nr:hypothetical protein SARC_11533 [Sphaeroforma arctica JP610]KNC75954.1 hypothetical protein SARC_11533 [Sphaeroforma arctica JP610]|eukprot:XP_014149856.1 hypothetical protein SARC_11533 [Sphaeroforma arctica JP610]
MIETPLVITVHKKPPFEIEVKTDGMKVPKTVCKNINIVQFIRLCKNCEIYRASGSKIREVVNVSRKLFEYQNRASTRPCSEKHRYLLHYRSTASSNSFFKMVDQLNDDTQHSLTKSLMKGFAFCLFLVPGLIFLLVPAHIGYIVVCKYKYEMDVTVRDAVQLMLFGGVHFADMKERHTLLTGTAASASNATRARKNL